MRSGNILCIAFEDSRKVVARVCPEARVKANMGVTMRHVEFDHVVHVETVVHGF